MAEGGTLASFEASFEAEAERFAGRVRELRRGAQMTLQQLSAASSLAPSTISKIENGQLSPTYETILRLAQGLQVEVADLFRSAPSGAGITARRSITRRGQGEVHTSPQYRYEMLAAEVSRKAFVTLVTTVKARDVTEFPELPRHGGEELVYVLAGAVALHTEHYGVTVLEMGDACYFDSTMGHALVSVGPTDARVLWITARGDDLAAGNADGVR